jgi:hypothetical protein
MTLLSAFGSAAGSRLAAAAFGLFSRRHAPVVGFAALTSLVARDAGGRTRVLVG